MLHIVPFASEAPKATCKLFVFWLCARGLPRPKIIRQHNLPNSSVIAQLPRGQVRLSPSKLRRNNPLGLQERPNLCRCPGPKIINKISKQLTHKPNPQKWLVNTDSQFTTARLAEPRTRFKKPNVVPDYPQLDKSYFLQSRSHTAPWVTI